MRQIKNGTSTARMEKSKIYLPKNLANDKLTVTYNNGFYGKMGKLQYFTKSLNPEEIAKLYMAGPEGSSGLTGSLFNNGQITNSSS